MENPLFKSGFIAVCGKPNVGKSSIINAIIGQKIVITSDKPQTTRNKINCIYTQPHCQMVFVDTPGIHKPLHKFGEYLVKIAVNAVKGTDAILFVVDACEGIRASDEIVADIVKQSGVKAVLAINKMDIAKTENVAQEMENKIRSICPNITDTVNVSAKSGKNVGTLVQKLENMMPQGPMYYPQDEVTDKPSRFIVSELIREKILYLTQQEVPHSSAVVVEDFEQRENGTLYIRANIYLERDSQKGIVIGKDGAMIKQIGQLARKDIERMFEEKVFLDLFVKVKDKWRENDFLIMNTMGFKDEFKKGEK
jgi:GTP-binding protein Era